MSAEGGQGQVDVLVVDDNQALADALAAFLRDQGLSAETAGGSEAAVGRIDAGGVSLVAVSTGLPHGVWADVARHACGVRPRPKVLLLASTRPTARVLALAKELGVEGIVPKAGGPRAALDRVRKALPRAGRPASSRPAPVTTPGRAVPAALAGRTGQRPLPPGIQVDGAVKPGVAEALSQLKRRPRDDAAAWGKGGGDAHTDDPLFAGMEGADAGRGHGRGHGHGHGLSRAGEEHRLGLGHFGAGRHEAALQHFVNAWNLEPSTPIYLAYKVRCQCLLAKTPPAPDGDLGDDLRMAAMMDPTLPEPALFLGHMYVAAGRPADARRYFKQVLDRIPGHAEAKAALAKIVNAT